VTVVQYESTSYAFGGWGAVLQTGVSRYYVGGWMCSCPMNATMCCVPPFAGSVWTAVSLLALADLLTIVSINMILASRKMGLMG
jgi:hypothetical protein